MTSKAVWFSLFKPAFYRKNLLFIVFLKLVFLNCNRKCYQNSTKHKLILVNTCCLTQGFYLPWAMLALDLIFGDPLMPDILGMLAGHLYYFLTVLHPLSGGKFIFKTPIWVYPSSLFLPWSSNILRIFITLYSIHLSLITYTYVLIGGNHVKIIIIIFLMWSP